MRPLCALLVALAAASVTSPAMGAEPTSAPSGGKRALATGAAIVPGALVHGAGSFVLGKKKTAKKLAIAGGIGALTAVTGLAIVALTGASRRFVAPLALTAVAGVGLFATSGISDLYSVLAPDGGTGEPLRFAPRYETRLGVLGVYDPVFQHGALVDERVDARFGWLRLSGAGQFAPGSTSRRLRAESAVRLHGPETGPQHRAADGSRLDAADAAGDGSYVDAEIAITDHVNARDRFGSFTGEASLRGRYDLMRFDDALTGSFVEGLVGFGLVRDRYQTRLGRPDDVADLLLARLAWGMYLGRGSEALLFYDHRRDGYAGGLKPNGIAAGYLGSVGASARVYPLGSWGIGADVQAGAAILAGLSLLYRSEGP